MTSIFEGQPPKDRAFSNQKKGRLGSRIHGWNYIYIDTWIFQVCKTCAFLPNKPTKRQIFCIFGRSRYRYIYICTIDDTWGMPSCPVRCQPPCLGWRWWCLCYCQSDGCCEVSAWVVGQKKGSKGYTLEDERLEPTNHTFRHLDRNMIFQTSMIMFHVNLQGCTWRIIPVTKWLGSLPFTKPFLWPFGRITTTRSLGDLPSTKL